MASPTSRRDPRTATLVLDVAERLVQTLGFNGFSYAHIANELRISKAALHYHFATKADLGEALVDRYTERFGRALNAIAENEHDARAMLGAYVDLYRVVLHDGRMCLCGMLAAEQDSLPAAMQAAVAHFFTFSEQWVLRVLERGRDEGSLAFAGEASEVAQLIIGGLEGAMLIARLRHDHRLFEAPATRLLHELEAPIPERRSEEARG